ncbi:MAG: bifunctional DNA primase/polymerase [Planctomycetales bacterium]|nr:bifunctional DNA primase/polymerase [Planctomycetales bacterium]
MNFTIDVNKSLLYSQAFRLHGLSVIPIRLDGSKAPVTAWKQYQSQIASESELQRWFGKEQAGVGIVCGNVSKLIVIDFDYVDPVDETETTFADLFESELEERGLLTLCWVIATPRGDGAGRHYYFRVNGEIPTSEKLAAKCNGELICESRGDGSYVIAPGSPTTAHPEGGSYTFVFGKPTVAPDAITSSQLESVLDICRSFGCSSDTNVSRKSKQNYEGPPRPGDVFNSNYDPLPLLLEHGWQVRHESNGGTYLTRPGKNVADGHSATYGVIRDDRGWPLLHVFSSSAAPFELGKTYDPFGIFATLEFNGDYGAAAAAARETFPDEIEAAYKRFEQIEADHAGCDTELEDEVVTPWPVMDEAAYRGLAGEIVHKISPSSEADPVAVLLQLLVVFGCIVGRGPYVGVEGSPHFAKLFVVITGKSAKSRKGTSWGRIEQLLRLTSPMWLENHAADGIGSGEALVHLVRDTRVDAEGTVTDAGCPDKRLMIQESEFTSILKIANRDSSTLSPMIRNAWDNRTLRNVVKTNPAKSTGSHICIVGHITNSELQMNLRQIEIANGLANRFLFCCVRRAQLLPHGGALTDAELLPLAKRFISTASASAKLGEVRRSPAADLLWERIYREMADEDDDGMIGSLTARAEAQTLRLSLIYALLDGSSTIEVTHLESAYAVWRYCRDSVRYLFFGTSGDTVADRIMERIRAAGDAGASRTDLRDLFSGHVKGDRIEDAIKKLENGGKIKREHVKTAGRQKQILIAK